MMRRRSLPSGSRSSSLTACARIFHVSGISQAISASACDAAFAAMEAAYAAGVKVSYDTNLRLKLWPLARARATILASLARCDLCLPSVDDGARLARSWLLASGCQ
jgi:2-dehydro-3-deoxygluconokinase